MAKAPARRGGLGTALTDLLKLAFGFFGEVLQVLRDDRLLAFAWGVVVVLVVVLLALLTSGKTASEDYLYLFAGFIVVSIVGVFAFTVLRVHPPGAAAAGPAPLAGATKAGRRALDLLDEIDAANRRILARGRSGAEPWASLLRQTYNPVCQRCAEQRLIRETADALCGDSDLRTVCDKKWLLGEALETWRGQLQGLDAAAAEQVALELQIRRSVVQPDCTPGELDAAIRLALARAREAF